MADAKQGGRQATAAPDLSFAIELKGISKAFGPVQANRDINIAVPRGTIHGIIGENGARALPLMLLEAIRLHLAKPVLVEQAMVAMQYVLSEAHGHADSELIRTRGGIDIILDAMRRHAEIAELQATTPEEAMQMCAGASSAAASERPAASLGDGRPLGQRACPSTLAHRPCAQGRAARRVSVQRRELPSLLGALSRLDPARGRGARQPPGAAEHGGRRRRLPRLPRRAQGGGGRRHVPHPRVRPSVRRTLPFPWRAFPATRSMPAVPEPPSSRVAKRVVLGMFS